MKHTSFKTRFLALVLTVVMLIGMMPSGIVGAEDPALAMGTASAITEGATVTDAAGADPVITFTDLTLKWEAKNPAVGRFQDGWWFGIKVTAPEGMTKQSDFVDGEKFVAYKSAVRDNTTATVKNFWNAQDSNAAAEDTTRYLTMWGLLNEEYLVEGSLRGGLSYAWSFDWDMDGIFEQQVTVKLDPAKLTLIKNDQTVFPAGTLGKASSLTAGGAVSGSMTNLATVTFDQVQLEWSPADPMLGRNSDGWWAGIRIDAPAGMTTQEDLTNAVYQTGVGTGWSANKSFWNAQDSDKNNPDTTRFLTMWGLLDEQIIKNAGADGIVRYSWRFDWDGDGVFEQRLHLDLKVGGITLMKDGAQTYPLGAVSSMTAGGAVSGSQTPESVVTFDQVELEWSPADPSIGRFSDGWWTGIRMDAPAGMTTEEALKNAVYQRLDGENWSANKSFWNAQDSDKNNPDTTRYLTMWGLVDKATLESAGADGKMTYAWQFDWDGNGTFDQLLTLELITDGIVLKQGDVQVYPLQTNVTTSVGTVGAAANGQIPVMVDGCHIDWAEETDGREAGWWVNLQIAAPAGLTEEELQAATFSIGEGEAQSYIEKSITTDGGKTVIDVWVPVDPESETAIVENVHLDWDGEGTNSLNKQTVALTVNVANMTFGQAPLSFENALETIEFGDVATFMATGGSGDGVVTYALKDETSNAAALIPESGEVTGTDLGQVTIVATKAADGRYTETSAEYTLTVEQRKLTVDIDSTERVYGVVENFTYGYTDTLAHENAELVVTFTTEDEAKTLPGTYAIDANAKVMVGDVDVTDYYDITVNAGTLTVNKAPRDGGNQPVFAISEPTDFLFGSAPFANAVKADYPKCGEQSVTYSIETNEIAATIDPATGAVTILPDVLPTENSSITVTATIAEDDGYLQGTAVYTMRVRYADAPAITLPDTADWYTEDVAQVVPEGYQIGFAAAAENGLALPAAWSETLTYDQEGIHDYTFFLKDAATGAIAAPVTVTGLKLDKTDPTVTVRYGETVGQTLLEKLFFIRNEEIQVTVEFEDTTSGIGAVALELDGEEVELTAEEIGAGTYVYTVNKTVRDHLVITVTDNAGRTGEPTTDSEIPYDLHMLVFDQDPADITAEFSGYSGIVEGDQPDSGADDIYYSNGDDFYVVFTVSDDNLDLVTDRILTVKINSKEETYALDEGNQVKIKLTGEGEYVISASFVDAAGNTQTITRQYIIDPKAATIEAKFVGKHVVVPGENPEETVHYSSDETFKVVFTVVDPKLNMNKNNKLMVSINGGEEIAYEIHKDTKQVEILLSEEGAYTITASFTKDTERTGVVTRKYVVDYTDPIVKDELKIESGHTVETVGDKNIYFTDAETFPVEISLVETNFNLTEDTPVVKVDGEEESVVWNFDESSDLATAILTLSKEKHQEGLHEITITYTDGVTKEATATYWVCLDYAEAEVKVESIDENGDYINVPLDGEEIFYTNDVTLVVTVTDHNYGVNGQKPVLTTGDADHVIEWKALEGDENGVQATVTLSKEMLHELKLTYTDSVHEVEHTAQVEYDKTPAVIEIALSEENKTENNNEGRLYYAGDVTATITITEKNFDPALVDVTVTGAAAGEEAEPVAVEWKEVGEPDGDTHTLEMVFTAESNYTLTVDYVDQAGNDAEEKTELFTIDSKLPHTPIFSYSPSIHGNLLEKLSLGFYQSQMTVTVDVADDVSGIRTLTLVTEQGSFDPVGEITQNGNVFTAKFNLPKDALTKDNQFKGKVYLIATDWAGNTIGTSDLKATDQLVTDDTTLILDNISPVGTFTVDPAVQEVESIRYFDGQFQIHMSIVEANYLDYKTENGAVVTPVVTLKKDGEVVAHGMGGWSNACTNTLTLTEDGEYEVSVSYTDGSNNPMVGANIGNATWTSGKLTLDTTLPQITVTNIKQNSANKDDTYGFVITVTDINLDVASVKPELTAVLRGEDGLYTTQTIDLGVAEVDEKNQTVQYTVENLDQDALYTLTCYAKDLANNETKEMLLADGEAYETVSFSINREGSTYGFGNDTTEDLVNQYYVHSVYEDVVIVEVNVDPIENYTVTVNGTELVEGTDYTTEQTGGGDQWSKRTYIISKEYFASEGQYNIVVSSTDKANTTSYSDIKNLAVAFVVDQTAPVLTISGLQTGGRYQTSEQVVTLVPTDEGGRLNSLKILLLDSDGEPMVNKETGEDISVRFDLSGEELIDYLEQNGGSVTFTIPVGLEMQVQIICNDCALNDQGLTNEYNEIFQRVTVSENIFVIFYANKPAFYGTIAGVAALVILVVVLAKRKKNAA